MRESRLMLINYLCMMLIGVTLFLHLATHAFLGVSNYEESLTYQSVIGRYQALATAVMLTVLLFTLVYHSVFSFRTFLLEWRHGRVWSKAVNWGAVTVAVVMAAFGMWTIMAAQFLR
jgi:succinate dehydrogenase hydrophobic anchor subunit